MIHDETLERSLQIIHAIIQPIGDRVDIFTVNRRDKRHVEFINDAVINLVRLMLEVDDLFHPVACLARVRHDLIYHERPMVEVARTFRKEIKEFAVLVLEFKHLSCILQIHHKNRFSAFILTSIESYSNRQFLSRETFSFFS